MDKNTLIGIVASILVSVIIFFWGLKINHPKLLLRGGGAKSKGGENLVTCHYVTIENYPYFFGFRVHRQPVKLVSARLIDESNNEHFGLSKNWSRNRTEEMYSDAELGLGERVSLYLFVKDRDLKTYSICRGSSEIVDPRAPVFGEMKKEFTLQVRDHIGKSYKFRFLVHKREDGLSVQMPMSFQSRFNLVRTAYYNLKMAFSFSRYS